MQGTLKLCGKRTSTNKKTKKKKKKKKKNYKQDFFFIAFPHFDISKVYCLKANAISIQICNWNIVQIKPRGGLYGCSKACRASACECKRTSPK